MKQNPFSFYDFLGYMIPGAVLLYLFSMIFGIAEVYAVFNIDTAAENSNELTSYIPAVICAYLIGHVLAIGSSAVTESYANITNGYPSEFLFGVVPKGYLADISKWEKFGRIIIWVVMLPISFLDFLLKDLLGIKIFNQAKHLPKPLRLAVFDKCKATLKDRIKVDVSLMEIGKGIDGDYLRLLYHFVFEMSERHAGKLQNYVALYGLTRNVSFVFILAFWGTAIAMLKGDVICNPLLLLIIVLFAYAFYIGFVKFYRRYSLEAVMATSVFRLDD